MNQFVPNWSSNMGDAFAPLCGEDDGLMELLWCNGPVVLQNQAPRKPPPRSDKEAQENETAAAAAWLQYPAAVEDPLERDLFSQLFGEAPAACDPGRACKEEEERAAAAAAAAVAAPWSRMMLPPMEKACMEMEDVGVVSDCEAGKTDGGDGAAAAAATEAGDSSMLTIGSSFCGSNHVQTARPPARAGARDAAVLRRQGRAARRRRRSPERQAEAARRRGDRGRGVRVRRRDVRAGAEADDGQAAARRRSAQPLGTEETGQDQREDEGAAGAHTILQQNGQGVDAGRGDRVPKVAAAPAAGDVDGRRHGGGGDGAGDVPGGRAPPPVHAADGGAAAGGLHAQDAVHGGGGAAGAERAGGTRGGGRRPLRALPRRRLPADAVPHALPAGDELLPAAELSATAAAAVGCAGRQLAGGDRSDASF